MYYLYCYCYLTEFVVFTRGSILVNSSKIFFKCYQEIIISCKAARVTIQKNIRKIADVYEWWQLEAVKFGFESQPVGLLVSECKHVSAW